MRLIGSYQFTKNIEGYLKRTDVQTALKIRSSGIADPKYDQCSGTIWNSFTEDFQLTYTNLFAPLLNYTKILVYQGQFDLRCNTYGVSEYLRNLEWSGTPSFNYQKMIPYTLKSVQKGVYKGYKNLQLLVIYSAGHLSPMDQGEATLEMVRRFTSNLPLSEKCTKEPCATPECPNLCSNNGVCTSDFTCRCDPFYSGEDCSSYQKEADFGTNERFKGYIFGKSYNVYYLDLPINKFGVGSFDVKITLTKISDFGKIHLLMNGGKSFTTPSTK
jgi:hypothetical protein